jgi:hypothetical protein
LSRLASYAFADVACVLRVAEQGVPVAALAEVVRVEANQRTDTPYPVLSPAKYPYPQSVPGNVVIDVAISVMVLVAIAGDTVMATALPEALADTSVAVALQETDALRRLHDPDHTASHSGPDGLFGLMAPALIGDIVVLRFPLFIAHF